METMFSMQCSASSQGGSFTYEANTNYVSWTYPLQFTKYGADYISVGMTSWSGVGAVVGDWSSNVGAINCALIFVKTDGSIMKIVGDKTVRVVAIGVQFRARGEQILNIRLTQI